MQHKAALVISMCLCIAALGAVGAAAAESPEQWLKRADHLRLTAHDYKSAIDYYTRAIEAGVTDDGSAYNGRGICYFELGRHEQALADYRRAIWRGGRSKSLHVFYGNRAGALAALGRHRRAIRDYTKAIELGEERPEEDRARLTVAMYYRKRAAEKTILNDYAGAVADYTASLKLAPVGYQAYIDRAAAYRAMGEHDKALADFGSAIRLAPDRPDAYLARGILYRDTGKYDKALADLRKACDLGDADACRRYNEVKKMR